MWHFYIFFHLHLTSLCNICLVILVLIPHTFASDETSLLSFRQSLHSPKSCSYYSAQKQKIFPASSVPSAKFYFPHPSPTAGSFRCKVVSSSPSSCKFVLYLVPFGGYHGEQFSQQRLAVMEAMHWTQSLGPQFVLVEPMFVITPHDNLKIEKLILEQNYREQEETVLGRYVVTSSELFDLKLLGSYFKHRMGIVLWADFVAMFPDNRLYLDILFMDHGRNDAEPALHLPCVTNKFVNADQEFYNFTFHVHQSYCQPAIRTYGSPVTNVGLPKRVLKAKNIFMSGLPYRTAFFRAAKSYNTATFWGLLFWRSLISNRFFQWSEDKTLDYFAIRRRLLYSKKIWDKALSFTDANLTRPFVAMQIRRGDKILRKDIDPCRSLAHAADLINLVKNDTSAKSVFIMTDIQHEDQLQELQKSVSGGFVQITKNRFEWKMEIQNMLLESAICVLADYFISSNRGYWSSSSPSRDIMEIRNDVFKMNPETTIYFGR